MIKHITTFLLLAVTATSYASPKKMYVSPNSYGTHVAPLVTVLMNTQGPVLELGSGDFSTTILHAICARMNRFLLSIESDKEWMRFFIDLENEWHHFQYVPIYENCADRNAMTGGHPELWDAVGNDTHWSVVFIDHLPGTRRVVDVQRLRTHTDIFVIHDTETAAYGYEPTLSTFKYRYSYMRYTTQTTVVSDTVDVRLFFE